MSVDYVLWIFLGVLFVGAPLAWWAVHQRAGKRDQHKPATHS